MNLPPLILASASPRRVELLGQLKCAFRVVPSQVGELHHDQFTARELARINAHCKAQWVAKQHPEALVIGADTLVYLGTQLFGKPLDLTHARLMLHELQGRIHQVVTGVCLIHLAAHRQRVFSESTEVHFRELSSGEIDRYLASINPLDKAGAYAIQEQGESLVAEIRGSYSNVVGLPMERLEQELNAWNEPVVANEFAST